MHKISTGRLAINFWAFFWHFDIVSSFSLFDVEKSSGFIILPLVWFFSWLLSWYSFSWCSKRTNYPERKSMILEVPGYSQDNWRKLGWAFVKSTLICFVLKLDKARTPPHPMVPLYIYLVDSLIACSRTPSVIIWACTSASCVWRTSKEPSGP